MVRFTDEGNCTYSIILVQDIRILGEPDEVASTLWDLQPLSFYRKKQNIIFSNWSMCVT